MPRMAKPRLFVTRSLPKLALDLLAKETELEIYPHEKPISHREIVSGVRKKDALLCLLTDRIDKKVIAAGPELKFIATYSAGTDHIDITAATERGIVVLNTPGMLTETVADLTWALILGIARRVAEADRFTRAGRFRGWAPLLMLGSDVYGKILGIIGLGKIGLAVARRAKGFNMKVLYFSRRRIDAEKEEKLVFAPLEKLLQESDFITLHVPLTPETRHMIGEREIAIMKPTAYLINTSRGPVVDEAALVKALKQKKIAGAALDVYENEPEIHPALLRMENVLLLPHIGSASIETRTKMAIDVVTNLLAALRGERPANMVNPEVWQRTHL